MAASLDWILREPLGHTLPQPHPFPHGLGGGDPGIALFCPTQNGIAEGAKFRQLNNFLCISKVLLFMSPFLLHIAISICCFGLYGKSLRKVRQMLPKWQQQIQNYLIRTNMRQPEEFRAFALQSKSTAHCHFSSCHLSTGSTRNQTTFQESSNMLQSHSFLEETVKGPSNANTESYLFPTENIRKKETEKEGREKRKRKKKHKSRGT